MDVVAVVVVAEPEAAVSDADVAAAAGVVVMGR
jgi:hypothetical protein